MKLLLIIIFLSQIIFQDKVGLKKDSPEKILIINSFDAQSLKTRNNKKHLFGELADSLKQMLYAEMNLRIPAERIVIPGLINAHGNDSIYFDLINKHNATKAIVIKNVNAYFYQTGVEVTRGSDGKKERSASYDIVAEVEYTLYGDTSRLKEFETKVWQYFNDRSVVSGLLAAGPDIVGKHKHAFKIVRENAKEFAKELDVYLQKSAAGQ